MKLLKSGCDLKTCLLCRLCKKEWIPAVALHRTNHKYNKGEVIFKEDEEVKGILFVYDGTVKVHKHWGPDKELILRFAKKGNIIGHRGLGKDLVYPVSGTAIEPTTTCFFPLEFFQASLKVNYDFLYELMQFFATELKESERNMRNLAHMSVKNRITQALLTLEEKFGTTTSGSINIIISRQDLASFAGTTYETVFRVLNDLISEKVIEVNEKQIRIINKEFLMLNPKSAFL
jgi:CRP/FNR family transcriptional regulator